MQNDIEKELKLEWSHTFSCFAFGTGRSRSVFSSDQPADRSTRQSISWQVGENGDDNSGVGESGVDDSGVDESGVDESGVDESGVVDRRNQGNRLF